MKQKIFIPPPPTRSFSTSYKHDGFPKVTLSMPIYNVEKYVERALLSALNQTFESIEYLLVDDKGTDGSMDVVRKIIATHPRGKDVRIIDHGVNKGTGATKNSAMDYAQGEFLYFMDSDDEITPDCISILYEKMMETPVDFVVGSQDCIFADGKISAANNSPDMLIKGAESAVANAYYFDKMKMVAPTWNKLYNVTFLKANNIRCISSHLNEDLWFTYQIILKASSCRLLSNITYHYRVARENSTTTQSYTLQKGKQFEEIVMLKNNYAREYRGTVFYSRLINQTYAFAQIDAINIYKSELIPWQDKKMLITSMLTYPIGYQEIMKIREGKFRCLLLYFISKLPLGIKISIFSSPATKFFKRTILAILNNHGKSKIKKL